MRLKASPGTYVLLLHSAAATRIGIGRWGQLDTRRGWYLYVGSAFGPGGVGARVARHCRGAKSRHWHIDYLRDATTLRAVWYSHAPLRLEHAWADAIMTLSDTQPIDGFGCSDCRCASHLFYTARRPSRSAFADVAGVPVATGACDQSG